MDGISAHSSAINAAARITVRANDSGGYVHLCISREMPNLLYSGFNSAAMLLGSLDAMDIHPSLSVVGLPVETLDQCGVPGGGWGA